MKNAIFEKEKELKKKKKNNKIKYMGHLRTRYIHIINI